LERASYEKGDGRCKLLNPLKLVGYHYERAVPISHLLEHSQRNLSPRLVETTQGFVEQENVWIVKQGSRNRESLQHAAAECARRLIAPSKDPHLLQQFVDAFCVAHSKHTRNESQILTSGERIVQHGVVRHETHRAVAFERSSRGFEKTGQDPEECSLPSAVRADDSQHVTAANGEIHVVEDRPVTHSAGHTPGH
jgi:hypothetical protein